MYDRNTRMVLKLKRNNIQKKKKKKYSFTIAKKIDHTLLKISYLFCYVFAAKLAVAIPQTFTRISFSIKHNHDYNIDP